MIYIQEKKSKTSPFILKSRFNELKSTYTYSTYIYTDGSKDDMRVGCAVVSDNYSENMLIPDGSLIFTAEAKAFELALDFTADCEISNNFIIFFRFPFRFEVSRPYLIK